ncbi:hypothetical protein PQR15_35340 [Streptomyces lydicus]|nr:hypothetical protein [Streptomyces lydicus]
MNDLSQRLAALSPEQRRVLGQEMRRRAARTGPAAAAETPGAPARQSLYFFASADTVSLRSTTASSSTRRCRPTRPD